MRYTLILLAFLIGCSADTQESILPAVLQESIPPRREHVRANGNILLEFDKRPINFKTDAPNGFQFLDAYEKDTLQYIQLRDFLADARKKIVVIRGPFIPPVTEFKVYWGATEPQESETFAYIVLPPF